MKLRLQPTETLFIILLCGLIVAVCMILITEGC